MKTEEWRDIPGLSGLYQASDCGRIRSVARSVPCKNGKFRVSPAKVFKKRINHHGYQIVCICINGKKSCCSGHRLVMYAFHGHSELDIDHINGNKSDNRIENLRYCSKRENVSFNNRKDYNKKTSKYTGVSYYKRTNSWRASIEINKKDFYLGNFKTEYDAHLAYQNKLKNHA